MLFGDFYSKLRQLNPDLSIDCDKQTCCYHEDFATAGLYIKNRKLSVKELFQLPYYDRMSADQIKAIQDRPFIFIMGVNHGEVPEYSIMALNMTRISYYGYSIEGYNGETGKWIDWDFVQKVKKEVPKAIDDRILARGYRAILANLVQKGYVNKDKAEKLFGITIEPNKPTFPKRYIDLYFTEGVQ